MSILSDEGCVGDLRGPNYPNYAMNVGHQGEYAAIVGSCSLWPRAMHGPCPR